MNDTTDVVESGQELVPAEAEGSQLVAAGAQHPVAAEGHAHPGPQQYVLIGLVLVVITACEVAVAYLDSLNPNLMIAILGVMAATKFYLVCAWFMHMKMDAPFFRRLFTIGIIGATVVYGVVMFMFASTTLIR